MWNPDPCPFPSSHPSDSLGSSPSLQSLPHPTRATFTSRLPHLPASVSHLFSLLSFRSPEPGTSASSPASARKKIRCMLPLPVRALGVPCPVGLGCLVCNLEHGRDGGCCEGLVAGSRRVRGVGQG